MDILGQLPAPKDKSQTEGMESKRLKKYDSGQRKRSFQTDWIQSDSGVQRYWLKCDRKKCCVGLTACEKHAASEMERKGPFVVGTDKFKLENIQDHEILKYHQQNAPKKVNLNKKDEDIAPNRGLERRGFESHQKFRDCSDFWPSLIHLRITPSDGSINRGLA